MSYYYINWNLESDYKDAMEDDDKVMQNALIYGTEKVPLYKLVTTTEMTLNSSFPNDSFSTYAP